MEMKLSKIQMVLLSLLLVLGGVLTAYAAGSVVQRFSGKYVPAASAKVFISPLNFNLTDMQPGDVKNYTFTIRNNNTYTIKITPNGVSSPAFVSGKLVGWDQFQARFLGPNTPITVTATISMGTPFSNPDVEQPFTGFFSFSVEKA